MPFGKWKGRSVSQIPTGYLQWLIQTCDLDYYLREAVRQELWKRSGGAGPAGGGGRATGGAGAGGTRSTATPPADWAEVVRGWYRGLCLKYHPDRGGSHEQMVVVQDAYERLQQLVKV